MEHTPKEGTRGRNKARKIVRETKKPVCCCVRAWFRKAEWAKPGPVAQAGVGTNLPLPVGREGSFYTAAPPGLIPKNQKWLKLQSSGTRKCIPSGHKCCHDHLACLLLVEDSNWRCRRSSLWQMESLIVFCCLMSSQFTKTGKTNSFKNSPVTLCWMPGISLHNMSNQYVLSIAVC